PLVLAGGTTFTGASALTLTGNATLVAPGGTPASLPTATVTGFGINGTGWSVNGGATVVNDVAVLTDNGASESRTVFANTQVPTGGNFTASFLYQAGGNRAADGFAFVLQQQTPTAVGGN